MELRFGRAMSQVVRDYAAHTGASFRALASIPRGYFNIATHNDLAGAFSHDSREIGQATVAQVRAAGQATVDAARVAGQATVDAATTAGRYAAYAGLVTLGAGVLAVQGTYKAGAKAFHWAGETARATGQAVVDGTTYAAAKAAEVGHEAVHQARSSAADVVLFGAKKQLGLLNRFQGLLQRFAQRVGSSKMKEYDHASSFASWLRGST